MGTIVFSSWAEILFFFSLSRLFCFLLFPLLLQDFSFCFWLQLASASLGDSCTWCNVFFFVVELVTGLVQVFQLDGGHEFHGRIFLDVTNQKFVGILVGKFVIFIDVEKSFDDSVMVVFVIPHFPVSIASFWMSRACLCTFC